MFEKIPILLLIIKEDCGSYTLGYGYGWGLEEGESGSKRNKSLWDGWPLSEDFNEILPPHDPYPLWDLWLSKWLPFYGFGL